MKHQRKLNLFLEEVDRLLEEQHWPGSYWAEVERVGIVTPIDHVAAFHSPAGGRWVVRRQSRQGVSEGLTRILHEPSRADDPAAPGLSVYARPMLEILAPDRCDGAYPDVDRDNHYICLGDAEIVRYRDRSLWPCWLCDTDPALDDSLGLCSGCRRELIG